MDFLFAKTKKLYTAQFYKLQIEHGAISMFFNKIEAVKIAKC